MFKQLLALGFLAAGGGVIYTALPHGVAYLIDFHLNRSIADFDQVVLPKPHVGVDYARYDNVALDPDGINTIGALTFVFTPQDLLLGRFSKIVVEDAEIIASAGADQALILDGWLAGDGLKRSLRLAPQNIDLRNIDLTLLTKSYGGITLNIEASATLSLDNNSQPRYEYQSRFRSEQRFISLYGTATGSFSDSYISAESEFERGKISVPDYKLNMTRLSGWGRLNYDSQGLSFVSELRSGGMRLDALPWQNAAMTYSNEYGQSNIFVSAQSVGVEGIELSITLPDNKDQALTRIHSPSEAIWNDYITTNNLDDAKLNQLIELLNSLNTEIEF